MKAGPDGGERALERFLTTDALRAQPPAPLVGVRMAARCSCGNRFRSYKLNKRKNRYVPFCSHCGGTWPRRRESVSPREIDGGRRPDPEQRLVERAMVERALGRLTSVQRGVLWLFLTWPGPGRADVGVAAIASERWPGEPFRWTPYRVREVVRAARAEFDAALERRED